MSSQGNTVRINPAPVTEQRICIECGFCCDGTLFRAATLIAGERGSLPELMEINSFRDGDEEYFRLPCRYFDRKCTIYKEKKAFVCSAYRCRLLKSLSDGDLTPEEVLEVIAEAKVLREAAADKFKMLTGKNGIIPFRDVLAGLNSLLSGDDEEGGRASEAEMMVVRCNILEALLIKHFRSMDDFEKLIMK